MNNIKNTIFIILTFIVIALFFISIYSYTYNIPKDDDFDSPLNAILKLNETTNWISYLTQLVEHHSDHRLFYLRITSLLYLKLLGNFNFQIYSILHSLLIIPLFYIIVKPLIFQKKYWEIFIISTLVFTIIYHDSLTWAHVSSNYTPVFLCAIFAIRQISGKQISPRNFIISLIISTIALGCFGNGLFLLLVIFSMLVIRKKYKLAAIWLSISIILAKLYFIGYVRAEYLPQPNYFGAYYGKILGILSLLGSQIALERHNINKNIFFVSLVFFFLLYFYIKNYKFILKNETFFYLSAALSFCLITLLVILLGRVSNNYDYLYIIQDRYRFYAVFALAIGLSLYFIHKQTNPFILTILTMFFVTNNIFAFINFKPDFDFIYKKQLCSNYNFQHNQTGLIYYINNEQNANERLTKFINKGYFTPPQTRLLDDAIKTKKMVITEPITVRQEDIARKFNEKLTVIDKLIYLEFYDFSGSSHRQNGCYFLLQSDKNSYYFGSMPNPHFGRNFLKNGRGVKSTISKNFLKKGVYKISIVEIQKNRVQSVKQSNQTIII